MGGFITEHHFEQAEEAFPGIRRLYEALARKPTTFLELVWKYEHRLEDDTCLDTAPPSDRT